MSKGIIYVMETVVPGLIKIGKTNSDQFSKRMRNLETNGYQNITGLRRFFAIEVEDYNDKESLLHEIFSKHQVQNTELFALDKDLVKQLLLSFEGNVIFPEIPKSQKEQIFEEITKLRKEDALFTFRKVGLKPGTTIKFIKDPNISAKIINDREVEYKNKIYKLSPLTRNLFESRNELNKSQSYRGAEYWIYKNIKLTNLPKTNHYDEN